MNMDVLKFFEDFSLKCSYNVKHKLLVLGVQLLFSVRTNQREVQTNRKYKPTGSTNQPEVQTIRKHNYMHSTSAGEKSTELCIKMT